MAAPIANDLVNAAWDGDSAAVKRLLKEGVDASCVGEVDGMKHAALQAAVQSEDRGTVEALLDAGAALDGVTRDDLWPPLHHAAGCSVELTRLLLERGADAKARDSAGDTPLHVLAFMGGPEACVAVLVEHGADPGAKNDAGRTPAQMTRSPSLKKALGATDARAVSLLVISEYLDLDRTPVLRGAYKRFLAKLAALSNDFAPKSLREAWKQDAVIVELTLAGKKRIVKPEVHPSGHFDLGIIEQVNSLLPAAARRFFVHNGLPQDDAICVALTQAERKQWDRNDRRKLWKAADFKRMKRVFAERDAEVERQ